MQITQTRPQGPPPLLSVTVTDQYGTTERVLCRAIEDDRLMAHYLMGFHHMWSREYIEANVSPAAWDIAKTETDTLVRWWPRDPA